MAVSFLPTSKTGIWSVVLAVLLFVLFAIGSWAVRFYEGVPSGASVPLDVVARPGVAVPMLTGFLSGILAFVVGLLALFRKKDRSVLAVLSTVIGGLLILFLVLEIAFPH